MLTHGSGFWKEIVGSICHIYYFIPLNYFLHSKFSCTVFIAFVWSFYTSIDLRPVCGWNREFLNTLPLSDRMVSSCGSLKCANYIYWSEIHWAAVFLNVVAYNLVFVNLLFDIAESAWQILHWFLQALLIILPF